MATPPGELGWNDPHVCAFLKDIPGKVATFNPYYFKAPCKSHADFNQNA